MDACQPKRWSLGDDARLLCAMQSLSSSVVERVTEQCGRLDSMLSQLDSTQLALNNAASQLQLMTRDQFVETQIGRVAPMTQRTGLLTPSVAAPSRSATRDAEDDTSVADAITNSISYMRRAYRVVHVSDTDPDSSDSDSVDEDSNIWNLQSRDIFSDRPLPYLIGSSQYNDDDYAVVGVISSSDHEGLVDEQLLDIKVDRYACNSDSLASSTGKCVEINETSLSDDTQQSAECHTNSSMEYESENKTTTNNEQDFKSVLRDMLTDANSRNVARTRSNNAPEENASVFNHVSNDGSRVGKLTHKPCNEEVPSVETVNPTVSIIEECFYGSERISGAALDRTPITERKSLSDKVISAESPLHSTEILKGGSDAVNFSSSSDEELINSCFEKDKLKTCLITKNKPDPSKPQTGPALNADVVNKLSSEVKANSTSSRVNFKSTYSELFDSDSSEDVFDVFVGSESCVTQRKASPLNKLVSEDVSTSTKTLIGVSKVSVSSSAGVLPIDVSCASLSGNWLEPTDSNTENKSKVVEVSGDKLPFNRDSELAATLQTPDVVVAPSFQTSIAHTPLGISDKNINSFHSSLQAGVNKSHSAIDDEGAVTAVTFSENNENSISSSGTAADYPKGNVEEKSGSAVCVTSSSASVLQSKSRLASLTSTIESQLSKRSHNKPVGGIVVMSHQSVMRPPRRRTPERFCYQSADQVTSSSISEDRKSDQFSSDDCNFGTVETPVNLEEIDGLSASIASFSFEDSRALENMFSKEDPIVSDNLNLNTESRIIPPKRSGETSSLSSVTATQQISSPSASVAKKTCALFDSDSEDDLFNQTVSLSKLKNKYSKDDQQKAESTSVAPQTVVSETHSVLTDAIQPAVTEVTHFHAIRRAGLVGVKAGCSVSKSGDEQFSAAASENSSGLPVPNATSFQSEFLGTTSISSSTDHQSTPSRSSLTHTGNATASTKNSQYLRNDSDDNSFSLRFPSKCGKVEDNITVEASSAGKMYNISKTDEKLSSTLHRSSLLSSNPDDATSSVIVSPSDTSFQISRAQTTLSTSDRNKNSSHSSLQSDVKKSHLAIGDEGTVTAVTFSENNENSISSSGTAADDPIGNVEEKSGSAVCVTSSSASVLQSKSRLASLTSTIESQLSKRSYNKPVGGIVVRSHESVPEFGMTHSPCNVVDSVTENSTVPISSENDSTNAISYKEIAMNDNEATVKLVSEEISSQIPALIHLTKSRVRPPRRRIPKRFCYQSADQVTSNSISEDGKSDQFSSDNYNFGTPQTPVNLDETAGLSASIASFPSEGFNVLDNVSSKEDSIVSDNLHLNSENRIIRPKHSGETSSLSSVAASQQISSPSASVAKKTCALFDSDSEDDLFNQTVSSSKLKNKYSADDHQKAVSGGVSINSVERISNSSTFRSDHVNVSPAVPLSSDRVKKLDVTQTGSYPIVRAGYQTSMSNHPLSSSDRILLPAEQAVNLFDDSDDDGPVTYV